MRNPALATFAFSQAFFDVVQEEQFIQDFLYRSLFRHLPDRFQKQLPVGHNVKTMWRERGQRKFKFRHESRDDAPDAPQEPARGTSRTSDRRGGASDGSKPAPRLVLTRCGDDNQSTKDKGQRVTPVWHNKHGLVQYFAAS